MSNPKILVIPGSLRAKSHNVRLAALATKELTLADADVTRISLADYPLPIYDGDLPTGRRNPVRPRTPSSSSSCCPRTTACSSPARNTTRRSRP